MKSNKLLVHYTLVMYGTLISLALPVFAAPKGPDMGYPSLPRFDADVNGDYRKDFCRFVGDAGQIFLSCQFRTSDGYSSNQYEFNSKPGIDLGYPNMPRAMKDVNDDDRADFCRYIGNQGDSNNPLRESCLLAGKAGFSNKEYRTDQ
ncbi:hypothetical protein PCC7424_5606 (plasmid) [Gloeothece citriformis PCC 7424]|uniref:Uncharacterized protein n=1 Tax=Gloeothece citriformis (strain PCC 7424) TaxID=65393 RepID=B7KMZ3_GLOC7|nr:hypothetical protein [Gloeothece citriformis]ACK74165.1 hypothetical protein PCC7424_5606 [Gloeothece citriformis PCC 7424]